MYLDGDASTDALVRLARFGAGLGLAIAVSTRGSPIRIGPAAVARARRGVTVKPRLIRPGLRAALEKPGFRWMSEKARTRGATPRVCGSLAIAMLAPRRCASAAKRFIFEMRFLSLLSVVLVGGSPDTSRRRRRGTMRVGRLAPGVASSGGDADQGRCCSVRVRRPRLVRVLCLDAVGREDRRRLATSWSRGPDRPANTRL